MTGNTVKVTNNIARSAGTSFNLVIVNKIKKPSASYTALIDITFYATDGTTVVESHSEYILLDPISISTGDSTMMLGSYSTFDVRTVLNIRFTLPAALAGYSSTVTDP